jgi:hypothetical protein
MVHFEIWIEGYLLNKYVDVFKNKYIRNLN